MACSLALYALYTLTAHYPLATQADGGGGRNLLLRVLTTRTSLLALIVASMSHVFAQGVGINTVMYYSASIIQMAGVGSASQAIWLAAGVNAAYVLFGFLGIAAVERAGRRVLMLASTAGDKARRSAPIARPDAARCCRHSRWPNSPHGLSYTGRIPEAG